jgi:hypothetical protein
LRHWQVHSSHRQNETVALSQADLPTTFIAGRVKDVLNVGIESISSVIVDSASRAPVKVTDAVTTIVIVGISPGFMTLPLVELATLLWLTVPPLEDDCTTDVTERETFECTTDRVALVSP